MKLLNIGLLLLAGAMLAVMPAAAQTTVVPVFVYKTVKGPMPSAAMTAYMLRPVAELPPTFAQQGEVLAQWTDTRTAAERLANPLPRESQQATIKDANKGG